MSRLIAVVMVLALLGCESGPDWRDQRITELEQIVEKQGKAIKELSAADAELKQANAKLMAADDELEKQTLRLMKACVR